MQAQQWTNDLVAQRFEECISVINKLPSGINISNRNYWPDIKLTPREIARQEKRRTVLRPLPEAIDRAEQTLQWIQFVEDPTHRKIIWLRAMKISWRGIARETGIPRSTAQRQWIAQLSMLAHVIA